MKLRSMINYFNHLPKEFRSKKSVVAPILAIGISLLGLFSVVSYISSNYDLRGSAATPSNLGNVPSGCYFMRGDCTGASGGSCKPILVCPTATPTKSPSMISCANCLSEGGLSLCLNLKSKVSICSNLLESTNSADRVCVPCKELPTAIPTAFLSATPTQIPSPTPTLIPTITLLPAPSNTPVPTFTPVPSI